MDVDLVMSDKLPTDVVDAVAADFRSWGLTPTVRLLPPRRGPAELNMLVLATLPLVSFLDTLGARFAEEAVQGLRTLVHRLLSGRSTAAAATGTAHAVVLQDVDSGTRVTLEPDLPPEGYRALLAGDLTATPGATLRYDRGARRWAAG